MGQLERALNDVIDPTTLLIEVFAGLSEPKRNSPCKAVVVELWGACKPADGRQAPKPGSLAWTYRTDQGILPLINVDCDRTGALIGPEIAHQPAHLREVYFGRALGRILAHELWHIIGAQSGHASEGLARAELTSADLLRRKFRLHLTLQAD